MNGVGAIVRANLRRTLNDRGNIFFLIVLPLLVVFALGSAIGGSGTDVIIGVVDERPVAASREFRAVLERSEGIELVGVGSRGDLERRVARNEYNAGYVATTSGGVTTVEWIAGIDAAGIAMRGTAESAAQSIASREQVVAALVRITRRDRAQVAALVGRLAQVAPTVRVTSSTPGGDDPVSDPRTIRAVLAAGQLTLFIFLTSMFGAQALLTSRLWGVTRRTRAAPVSTGQIIAGEAISRYVVAMAQAAIIVGGTVVLFGVDWKAPLGVAMLCAAMGMVGTGAAMLLGTLGRSEQQVAAVALLVSLVLAALGGSMQPLEFFPSGMRTVAFAATPHAWMNDALWRILADGEGTGAALVGSAVLTVVGVALIALSAVVLRRRIS